MNDKNEQRTALLVVEVTPWQSKVTEAADRLKEVVNTAFLPVVITTNKLGGAPSATSHVTHE